MMFASHGFSISLQIADIGLTKQELMYHFPNKQELLTAVIQDIERSSLESILQFFSVLLQVQDTPDTEQLENIVHLFVKNNLWAVLFLRLILENVENYLPTSFKKNHLLIIQQLENLQNTGNIKENIDVAIHFPT